DNIGVTGYRYSLNGGASWTNTSATSASLTGLTRATGYTLLVQARDAAGNWGASSSQGFTTDIWYVDNLTMYAVTSGDGWSSMKLSGYLQPGYGSMVPNTLTGGQTLAAYYSKQQFFFDGVNWYEDALTYIVVNGFSSNPGAGWLS